VLRVGLTGGIGSGKSMVAGRLAERGAVVVDADRIAREVVEPGTPAHAEILAAFGPDVFAADGTLDRAAMAGLVFADPSARARLNGIVHPKVGARTAELVAAAPRDAVVVYDIPLLVENGLAGFHIVLVVHAAEPERLRRLAQARGMTEEDARARIAAQATDEQRRAAADVWLDNSGTRDELVAAVDALWADRLVPYEANVRLRRGAARGGPRLVDYDPSWPVQAERLMARVRLAAGSWGLRIDHVGSTAVAGLPAKDVVDLQLTVASLADAEAISNALGDAGFPRLRHIDRDRPKPADPDPERWRKQVHVGADPVRAVNLHVRVAGSPGWRYTLLFRDWLCAEPGPRAEYARLKLRLAAQYADDTTTEHYAEAKEPWFTEAFPRAEQWATRTGWTPPAS
jgi:dephospho-CoA kinase